MVRWVAALFLAAFTVQGVLLIRHTSPTTDEIPFHAVNGYVYLKTGDFRMNPSSPALVREWMTLPWLALNPKLDLDKPSWRAAESQPFSEEFFWKDNRARAGVLLYASRFMVLFLGVALGILIFTWASGLYGERGGLAALGLYAFSPSFLAHSSIAATDVGTAFCFTAASYALWSYLEKGKEWRFCLFAILLGLSFAAKISLLAFGPVLLAAAAYKKGFRWFLRAAPLAAVISLFTVWAVYFFEFKPLLWDGVPRVGEKLEMIDGIARSFGADAALLRRLAETLPIPAPSYWLATAGILRHHSGELPQFAFGSWGASHPWWLYFFLFVVKMTLPFLVVLGLRKFDFFKKGEFVRGDALVIVYPAAVYFFLMCFEKTGHGHRYLLPVVATLTVWAGGVAAAPLSRFRARLVAAAVALHAAVSLAAFPVHLSYFNALAGGTPNAYKLVRDSDLDWGQSLKPLKAFLDENGIKKVTLEYFGTADPSFYGIEADPLTETEAKTPARRVYAISARYLEHAKWTADRVPSAVIEGSIFVYDLR